MRLYFYIASSSLFFLPRQLNATVSAAKVAVEADQSIILPPLMQETMSAMVARIATTNTAIKIAVILFVFVNFFVMIFILFSLNGFLLCVVVLFNLVTSV